MYSNLSAVRKAYDENYLRICEIIKAMGGEEKIKEHKRSRSVLYKHLIQLQKKEHELDELENLFLNQPEMRNFSYYYEHA